MLSACTMPDTTTTPTPVPEEPVLVEGIVVDLTPPCSVGNLIATIGANGTQYTTGDLGTGGVQSFYVVAFNAGGTAQSNTAQEDGCIF